MKLIVTLFISLLLSSLSFGQNQNENFETVSKNKKTDTTKYATLYVYRKKKFRGSFVSYELRMDNSEMIGKVLKTVNNNTFFVVKLYNEGETVLWAKTEGKSSVMVKVKFGNTYYLRCEVGVGVLVGRPKLEFVDNEVGQLEYEKMQ